MSKWISMEWWLVDDDKPVREVKGFIEAPHDPDGKYFASCKQKVEFFSTFEEAKEWIEKENAPVEYVDVRTKQRGSTL